MTRGNNSVPIWNEKKSDGASGQKLTASSATFILVKLERRVKLSAI